MTASQTGQMLAALGRPQATFASKVEISGRLATVTREVDAGLETLEVDLPAVITTDLRLNEPRCEAAGHQAKAKKKPLETLDAASLGCRFRWPALKLVVRGSRHPLARRHGQGCTGTGRRPERACGNAPHEIQARS